MVNLYFIGIIAAIVICETVAQIFLEKYHKNSNNKYYLYLGILLYALVGFIYSYVLATGEELGIANGIWNGLTIITVTLLGYLLFNQKISKEKIAGVVIILFGIYLLS